MLSNSARQSTKEQTMLSRIKTVTQYSMIPSTAVYIGSENGAGELEEFFYDLIADAEEPIRYRDPEGVHHYFNLINFY
jgi:hypothetical protein